MGRIIHSQYVLNGGPTDFNLTWRLFQEQTFELVRLTEFPLKPSRWKSIFLFQRLSDALLFIQHDKRDGEIVYEVTVNDKSKQPHRASMTLYERIPMGRPVLPALIEQARQYWLGANASITDPNTEILVESDVTVVQQAK